MRDLLDVLGVDQATILGHSLGGGVAAQIADQFPERRPAGAGASGGAGRDVMPVLRLAAAPLAGVVLAPLHWPVARRRAPPVRADRPGVRGDDRPRRFDRERWRSGLRHRAGERQPPPWVATASRATTPGTSGSPGAAWPMARSSTSVSPGWTAA